MKIPEDILDKIANFLEHRRESHGGWADVTKEDCIDLRSIVDSLISAKCEKDPDGDVPLEAIVINRRIYHSNEYTPLSYLYDCNNLRDIERPFEERLYNLQIATKDLDNIIRVRNRLKSKK